MNTYIYHTQTRVEGVVEKGRGRKEEERERIQMVGLHWQVLMLKFKTGHSLVLDSDLRNGESDVEGTQVLLQPWSCPCFAANVGCMDFFTM